MTASHRLNLNFLLEELLLLPAENHGVFVFHLIIRTKQEVTVLLFHPLAELPNINHLCLPKSMVHLFDTYYAMEVSRTEDCQVKRSCRQYTRLHHVRADTERVS